MPRYVAFLGGINLGKRRVAMKDLQRIVEEMGLEDVSTFIASGNVVFRTRRSSSVALEGMLEEHFSRRLGYSVATFLRTEQELVHILAARPFQVVEPGNTLCVILCKEKVSAAAARVLVSLQSPTDQFHVEGRELHWLTKAGISASTVWSLPEIKRLKLPPSTMRNRNTLERLAQKYGFAGEP